MSLKDFEIIKELGKGSYGSVFMVKRKQDSQIYALKKVYLAKLSKKEIENALNEIRLLASIRDLNIVSYLDSFYEESISALCLIMEYADNGDLDAKIKENTKRNITFPENEIWEYIYQIAKGLKTIHNKKILHRDLKSANIFISKNNLIKIGDMNISKVYKQSIANTQTGTPYYASPEIWKNLPYDYKSDIWSLGCIVYEMCMNKPPFRGNSMDQVYQKIVRGKYEPIPSYYSKTLKNILASIFEINPINRPSIDQILKIADSRKMENKIKEFNLYTLGNLSNTNSNCFNEFMLQTIKLPKNLRDINRNLPIPNYPSSAKM